MGIFSLGDFVLGEFCPGGDFVRGGGGIFPITTIEINDRTGEILKFSYLLI